MREMANERMRQMKSSNNPARTKRPAAEDAIEAERNARIDSNRRSEKNITHSDERRSERTSEPSGERRIQRSNNTSGSHSQRGNKASSGHSQRGNISNERRHERRSDNTYERLPERKASSSHNASRSRNNAPSKKRSYAFWLGIGIYTVVLLIISVIFLKYTDVCLKKYENSQSEHFMELYMEEFRGKVDSHSFNADDFTFESLDMSFVDTDSLLSDYIDSLDSYTDFEAKKDSTSYITEAPVYNILADGEVIAKITLKAISQTKIFAILTIMDWDVDTIEPVCSIDVTNMTFKVPEGYYPVIDGKVVPETYQTGVKEINPEFAYVSNYVDMPESVEYKVDNVLVGSEIKITNTSGEEIPYTTAGNLITASYTSSSAQMSEERKNEALLMVQTYEDFNTDDLSGANHGLATVQSFLIKDSDYWNMAKQWAGGVDITFTSAHVFDNPKYTNVVVDNYAEYSDKCYSVHIAFSKNMILTRTKEKISNDFDSTVFFVYYDDTDDGVDNPHWCIADMIATTK